MTKIYSEEWLEEDENEDDLESEDLDYEYTRWRGDYLDAGM